MIKFKFFIAVLSMSLFFISCDENRVYEQNEDFTLHEWKYEDVKVFDVAIDDTTPKTVFVNFRHTYFFSNRNVLMNLEVKFPNDSIYKTPLNILLSEPNGMWHSECSGDICDFKYPIKEFTNYSFPEVGTYIFSLTQDMRVNPLPNVMAVGLRVENLKK